MTPTEQIAFLQAQIDSLKAALALFVQSNTIPRGLEDALAQRLGTNVSVQAGAINTASFTSFGSFPVIVPQATGVWQLTSNGVTRNVLYQ